MRKVGLDKLRKSGQDVFGKDNILLIRDLFNASIQEERRLLDVRSQSEAQHAKDLLTQFVLLFVATLIFVPVLYWRIRTDLRLKQQIAIEQQRLTDILDASPDLIATANLQGEYFYLNKGGRNLLGLLADEAIAGHPISRMRPAWAIDLSQNTAIPTALNKGLWLGESAFINRAGFEIPVSQAMILHRNADGTPSYLSTVARDIRDFKKIEHGLRDAAIYDKTHSEVLRLFNANYDQAQILTGMLDILAQDHGFPVSAIYSYDEWSGSYRLETTHAAPADIQSGFKLGEGVMGEAAREKRTVVLADFNGKSCLPIETGLLSFQPAAIIISPVNYQDKRLALIVLASSRPLNDRDQPFIERLAAQLGVALNNIQQYGDMKLLAEQLRLRSEEIGHKNEQLEETNRMKSEFLATMSHELRTPLNAVIGFSEILRDGITGELTPQQKEYVNDIFESGQHLLSLINDVLDLSKIEAGRMELDAELTDIAQLLENSLSIVKEKAAAHHIQLKVDLAEDLGLAWFDPRKIKQVVYNLLSNAVKFTPEGGQVTLGASIVTRTEIEALNALRLEGRAHLDTPLVGDGERFLQLSVKDTGIGISAEDMAHLFQPFVQVESSLSRRFEGTGLGLAMVRKLAELHSGAVALDSTPGHGSIFMVWLQYEPEPSATKMAELPGVTHQIRCLQAASPRVLVLEDEDRAADLIRLQLESEGCRVTRAASAEAALALLAEGELPDLITLDILLPGMDGWGFLTRLKTDGRLQHIPVVILSIVADSNKGLSMGASQVLQKPVSAKELLSALVSLGFAKPEPGKMGAKVLVVDDDPKAVEIVSNYLENAGYVVLRAYGGSEAIQISRLQQPDMIVLDLMMPDISGFAVVESLKQDKNTAQIPIIAVTAKLLTPEERHQLNGSVLAVLEKSQFNHGNFINGVRRALGSDTKNQQGRE